MTTESKPERDWRIASYLTGEMAAPEREAFERAIAGDPELAAEVEGARAALALAGDWLASPPPGAERADALAIPPLALESARVVEAGPRKSNWFAQAAAAAALLAVGFWAGQATQPKPLAKYRIAGSYKKIETETITAAPSNPDAPVTNAVAAPPAVPGQQLASLPAEQAPRAVPVRSVRDEDGKLIMETVLPSSGVHAVWVIDGGFQMADSTGRTNQGE